VFLSSVEIYGENRGDTEKFSEDYCGYIDPNTLRAGYPESKRTGEALCQAYIAEKGVDAVILRLSRVYGATMSDDDSKAISQFIRNAVNKENIVLKSSGEQLFSYAFIADAATALLHTMLNGETGSAYNVASDRSDITLKDVASTLAKIAGVDVVFDLPNAVEAKGFSKATKACLNTERLKKAGWESRYEMNSGLDLTVKILKELVKK
jgi:nucleoside-diphosphate-sugar epimerase